MEGVPIKILGRATLNPTRIIPNLKYERKNKTSSGLTSEKTLSCKWPII